MPRPIPPTIDPSDDLASFVDLDLNQVLAPYLQSRMQSPIVQPSVAAELQARFPGAIPGDGLSLDEVLQEIGSVLLHYSRRNTHPGFFGYIAPSGVPVDPLSHALVATLNQNVVGYPGSPGAATIERTVIKWLIELIDYPEAADGVFIGGGSISNLTALACALTHRFGEGYRRRGLLACGNGASPVIICSRATHLSIQRAAAILGIGTDQVVTVDVDDDFRMRPRDLVQALEQADCPVCVVASAGTTTTGAIDPLADIAEICGDAGVWLHIDAAYGGGGLMSEELKPLYAGIERADSITMDLHKWFYNAVESSVILYRDPTCARQLFYERSDYIHFPLDGPDEQYMFFHLSPELSRRFRALPAYITFRHYGRERLGRNVLYNAQCAQYLAELVEADPDLELVAAPQLSICNFRYAPGELTETRVDAINSEIRDRIEAKGNFLMSVTHIDARPVLRVCIINHATRACHIEGLLAEIKQIGTELLGN
ncbi:MAG: aminotransferase class I/II-fold pyridoxal phosphate-dependent enzyme [Proteobacteria bacterium]|nr:aminotransferase class I/II-fold pyridoxal phosphate-dependent enzyme [Pseudomonadota bacterium]